MRTTKIITSASIALTATLFAFCSGCGVVPITGWSAGGNQASDDQYTYVSPAHTPQTISLIDTRTGEVIWSRDVPVKQQLSIKFYENENKKNPSRPDIMKYGLQAAGSRWGRLTDSITVPPPDARRIDVALRTGPEFPR